MSDVDLENRVDPWAVPGAITEYRHHSPVGSIHDYLQFKDSNGDWRYVPKHSDTDRDMTETDCPTSILLRRGNAYLRAPKGHSDLLTPFEFKYEDIDIYFAHLNQLRHERKKNQRDPRQIQPGSIELWGPRVYKARQRQLRHERREKRKQPQPISTDNINWESFGLRPD